MSIGLRAARVYQGIAVMDIHHGEQWVWGVNPRYLSMGSNCNCVVGQVNGGVGKDDVEHDPYGDGLQAMGLDDGSAVECGFNVDAQLGWLDGYCEFAALTRIWAYAIRRLREQRPQEVAA